MGHRTDLPAPPASVLTEPSYTAQTLLVAARVLEMQPGASLDRELLGRIRVSAVHAICGTLPRAVRVDVGNKVRDICPDLEPGTSRGTYAAELRQIAETV